MDDQKQNILAKKIRQTNFDNSAFPHLDGLALSILQLATLSMYELTAQSIEFVASGITMQNKNAIQSDTNSEAYYFRLQGNSEDEFVLVELSQTFLVSLSQSLLGCSLTAVKNVAPTELDYALISIYLEKFAQQFSIHDFHEPTEAPLFTLAPIKLCDSGAEFLDKVTTKTFLSIYLDISIGSEKMNAMVFHFPLDFIEKCGLLENLILTHENDGDETHWRKIMKANVAATPIDLCVTLDRFEMALSAIPKLKIGDMIPLEKFDRSVDLNLQTVDGELTIGSGILGAAQNKKAVKLVELRNLNVKNDLGATL
ncbi:MAG: FliM/FliN family flagellar motor switch protein [Marinicaulis sp.]|nr:FliM/FliN family flagellar motor switch protein [Marinicaulis sp.]